MKFDLEYIFFLNVKLYTIEIYTMHRKLSFPDY